MMLFLAMVLMVLVVAAGVIIEVVLAVAAAVALSVIGELLQVAVLAVLELVAAAVLLWAAAAVVQLFPESGHPVVVMAEMVALVLLIQTGTLDQAAQITAVKLVAVAELVLVGDQPAAKVVMAVAELIL